MFRFRGSCGRTLGRANLETFNAWPASIETVNPCTDLDRFFTVVPQYSHPTTQ